jgi:hypothetical protein
MSGLPHRRFVGENVCEECLAGEHDICLRGHLKGKDEQGSCDCHVTDHRYDNRTALPSNDGSQARP